MGTACVNFELGAQELRGVSKRRAWLGTGARDSQVGCRAEFGAGREQSPP